LKIDRGPLVSLGITHALVFTLDTRGRPRPSRLVPTPAHTTARHIVATMDLAGRDFPTLRVTPVDADGTRLKSGKINLADELLGSPAVIHFYDSG